MLSRTNPNRGVMRLVLRAVSVVLLASFLVISLIPTPGQLGKASAALSTQLQLQELDSPLCVFGGPGCGPRNPRPPAPTPPPCSLGTLPGQGGVSCTGAGTYEIPIEVPPGSADVQPALSLTYNSQGGNGLLGMGWSIDGLSTITRCAANMALDGYKGGINFDENDRYCLDGQRLVPVTPIDGSGMREYRTEPDAITRVRSYGTTGTGADYFTAEARSGLITEYGRTVDSFIEPVAAVSGTVFPANAARVWAANKLSDRVGNYIEYGYNEDTVNGEYSPALIKYTGNVAAGVLPYNFVKFEYEPRLASDSTIFFQSGSRVKLSQRLLSIRTCLTFGCGDQDLVTHYKLAYQTGFATNRTQLKSVESCDGDFTSPSFTCLPKTVMTWSDDGVTNLGGKTDSGLGGTTEWNSANFADTDTSFQKSDAPIYYDAFVTQVKGIANAPDAGSAVLGSLSLSSQLYALYANPFAAPLYIVKQFIEYLDAFFTDRYWIPKGKLGDVNGDGKIDLVGFAKQGDSKNRPEHVWLSTKFPNGEYQFVKQDAWKTNELRQDTDVLKEETTETDEAKLADFNDDGLMDVLSFEEKNNAQDVGVYVYESNGSTAFTYQNQKVDDVGQSPRKAIGHTSLGDFNGDGKPDLAKFTERDGVFGHVYLGNPNATDKFDPKPNWGLCKPFGIACERADTPLNDILMGDVNGDDKTDIIVLSEVDNGFGSNETHATIWLTNKEGDNWAPNPEVFDFDYDLVRDSQANVIQPGDFNGDGKMDLSIFHPIGSGAKIDTNNSNGIDNDDFAVISTDFRVYLSTGKTFIQETSFNRDLFSTQTDTTGGNAAFATDNQKFFPGYYVEGSKATFLPRLSDFNGDGKTDVMIFDADDHNYAHLWLSDGTKLRHDPTLSVPVPGASGNDYGVLWGSLFGKVDQVMIGDFEGDGRADVLSFARPGYPIDHPVQYDGQLNVTLSSSYPFPDLMTSITDGFGKKDQFEYKPLTDDDVYTGHTQITGTDPEVRNFRGPLYVVSKFKTSNGLASSPDSYDLEYTYSGAKSHRSYGFLGFSKIVISDPQKLTLETVEYEQTYPLICHIKSRTVRKAPEPNANTANQVGDVSTYAATWNVLNGTGPGGMPHVIQLEAETDIQYELNGAELSNTRKEYTYETSYPYNLRIERTTWPDQNPPVVVEEDTTAYDDIMTPSTWILGLPTSSTIARFQPTTTQPEITHRQFDAATGLLTSSTEVLVGGIVTTAYPLADLDVFGNPQKIIVSGSGVQTRTTEITYESKGRFPTSIKNPEGETTVTDFGPEFGNLANVTDPNGLSTNRYYDGYGRAQQEVRPDGTLTVLNYCAVGLGEGTYAPTLAQTVHWIKITTTGVPDKTVFYDKLGREVRTSTTGFNGTRVYSDSLYDREFRLAKVSQPYYQGSLSSWTDLTYDIRDRITSETAPNGAQTTFVYSANASLEAPNPFPGELTDRLLWHKATQTNALGEKTEYIVNRLDQVNQVIHRDSSDTLISRMTYSDDAFNNPLSVADENNNITSRTYENNLMVSQSDPDTGDSMYTYDVLGNLKSMTDAKRSANGNPPMTLSYDKLDRLTSRTDLEGTSAWVYGTSPSLKNIGHVQATSSGGGSTWFTESYVYDTVGRPKQVWTQIPGDVPVKTERTYDASGRIATITYPGPDNFTVRYVYNPYGYLSEVRNDTTGALIWQANSLNAAGQITQQTHGNTTPGNSTLRSTFSYDEMLNTTSIQHGDRVNGLVPTNGTKKQLTYDYNITNNLKEQRKVVRTTLPVANEDYVDQNSYDGLNRLLRTFSFKDDHLLQQSFPREDRTFDYDAIGNITKKSDISAFDPNYNYSPPPHGPHAVTGIVDSQAGYIFTYDENGNMTSGHDFQNGQTRSIDWYSYNKPSHISEGAKSLALAYDTYRDKIKQVYTDGANTTTTEYIGSMYEKVISPSGSTEHKYYIYGSSPLPVALYTTRTNPTGPSDMKYLHYDSLGSLDLITDETGTVVEDLSYDPHGVRRNADWTVANGPVPTVSTHGFTNHEHLDEFGLIDMKGRMYDPKIGRFISADPYITEPFLTENLNRYSYVHNSPTNFIDPSGFGVEKTGELVCELFCGPGTSIGPSVAGIGGVLGGLAIVTQPSVSASTAQRVESDPNLFERVKNGIKNGFTISTKLVDIRWGRYNLRKNGKGPRRLGVSFNLPTITKTTRTVQRWRTVHRAGINTFNSSRTGNFNTEGGPLRVHYAHNAIPDNTTVTYGSLSQSSGNVINRGFLPQFSGGPTSGSVNVVSTDSDDQYWRVVIKELKTINRFAGWQIRW